jgi:hypothetical protein
MSTAGDLENIGRQDALMHGDQRNPISFHRVAASSLGWVAISMVTLASSFWGFWGVIEAFHEGWCEPELWMRLLQVLAYVSPTIVLSSMAALSVRWPFVGASIFLLVGVAICTAILLSSANFGIQITTLLTVVPVLVGLLFLYGRPKPKSLAYAISLGVPVLVVIGFGAEPVFRVSRRFDDGNRGTRLVEGNGVTLLWAPAGPGWTRDGNVLWEEAQKRARYLTEDGLSLAEEPQDVWRLPTRRELVCSLTRTNQNAGGTWDQQRQRANYQTTPDKESPLWDPLAPLIYLWASEEASKDDAWIVVYHGGVYAKSKRLGASSLGFRAVREPTGQKRPGPVF